MVLLQSQKGRTNVEPGDNRESGLDYA